MNIETLKWAAQKLRELAPRWAKNAQPVYKAIGMGTSGTMIDGEYAETPVPTEKELLEWFLKTVDFFEGPAMQRICSEPRHKDRISMSAHNVVFSADELDGQRGYSVAIHLNSVTGSG